jgi:chemotaxis protein CheX
MEVKDCHGRLEIALPGVLDLPAAAELRDLLLDAAARDTSADVVLDGSAVARASTAAIQVMLAGTAALKLAARRLELEGASDALVVAFQHLGLASDLETLISA